MHAKKSQSGNGSQLVVWPCMCPIPLGRRRRNHFRRHFPGRIADHDFLLAQKYG
jgi:hypothetical protein